MRADNAPSKPASADTRLSFQPLGRERETCRPHRPGNNSTARNDSRPLEPGFRSAAPQSPPRCAPNCPHPETAEKGPPARAAPALRPTGACSAKSTLTDSTQDGVHGDTGRLRSPVETLVATPSPRGG